MFVRDKKTCEATRYSLDESDLLDLEDTQMVKVVKFGGSSLASAEQFQKVGDIIRADESRKYVVPSAPGKRFSDDIKVTDMLYDCYNTAQEGEKF